MNRNDEEARWTKMVKIFFLTRNGEVELGEKCRRMRREFDFWLKNLEGSSFW